MKVTLLKASVPAIIGALTMLAFCVVILDHPLSPEREWGALSDESRPSERIERLEHRVRELSDLLSESEHRVAEWEDSWPEGEAPDYFRKRAKAGSRRMPASHERGGALSERSGTPADRPAGTGHTGRTEGRGTETGRITGTASAAEAGKPDGRGGKEAAAEQPEEPRRVGGLLGLYYQGRRFEELKLVMTDYEVDFDFQDRSPDRLIAEDGFSVRWRGFVKVDHETDYTFHTLSDDGVRLWVDGRPVISNWGDHAPKLDSGKIRLKEGYHSLRLDFYENGGTAVIKLYWSSERIQMEIIPPASLCHDLESEEKARRELR